MKSGKPKKEMNLALVPDAGRLEEGELCQDFKLKDGLDGVWIAVDGVSVWIRRTGEGVEVALFPEGQEADRDPLDTAYAAFADIEDDVDQGMTP